MLAAVFLTVTKTVVGVMTGSLGLLAEAAHSGLDLVAASVTWFAVRLSDQPADRGHHFGHGKVENLSALFETLLLLATCAWIVWEAIHRLVHRHVEVETSIWAFLVVAISIVVDVHRSRMLYAAARKHHSQALEADALHFSTDIWSSAVVFVGLAAVAASKVLGPQWAWLARADAVAALGVACIVVLISAAARLALGVGPARRGAGGSQRADRRGGGGGAGRARRHAAAGAPERRRRVRRPHRRRRPVRRPWRRRTASPPRRRRPSNDWCRGPTSWSTWIRCGRRTRSCPTR